MFQILLIAFLLVPVIEIFLFIKVGGLIGAGWTIFVVIATAILGAALLRQQGLSTWQRLNQHIAMGQMPPGILVEGILLLVSGAFLLTPGFFTDGIGFLLLFPPFRKAVVAALLRRGTWVVSSRYSQTTARYRHQSKDASNVIEGDYERRDD